MSLQPGNHCYINGKLLRPINYEKHQSMDIVDVFCNLSDVMVWIDRGTSNKYVDDTGKEFKVRVEVEGVFDTTYRLNLHKIQGI